MNYLDVYLSRINHMGETTAERIRNGGIRSFEKWLAESPHTVRNLSNERGIYFDGIILTSKDKEYEKIMFLEVANDIPLLIGDIMNWTLDDGTVEKWILIQEEKKVNGTFRSFWIIRCNYYIKWVDAQGHLQKSWAYFVSSLDSKIKGNFRTWNSLITPQPNKYAEILMPRYPIDRATNFIVEEESWTVVEYDHTSVPGVIYLSLTEGKVNSIYDDLENNIADIDKLADYQLDVPPLTQIFHLGEHIKPVFTLTKNGKPCNEEVELISDNKKVVRLIDDELIAVGNGEANIIIQLKNYPEIKQSITITVGIEQKQLSAYIEGSDVVRLDRIEPYRFKTSIDFDGSYHFVLYKAITIDVEDSKDEKYSSFTLIEHPKFKTKLLALEPSDTEDLFISESILGKVLYDGINDKWIVHANGNNKLGFTVLGCLYEYNNEVNIVFKPLEIIPLW